MENGIRIVFAFNSDLFNGKTQAILTQIKHNKHAVSLHIRRGDYLEPKYWRTAGSVCRLPYYLNTITEINKRTGQPSYYAFSDDMAWVKENLPLSQAIFIGWNKDMES